MNDRKETVANFTFSLQKLVCTATMFYSHPACLTFLDSLLQFFTPQTASNLSFAAKYEKSGRDPHFSCGWRPAVHRSRIGRSPLVDHAPCLRVRSSRIHSKRETARNLFTPALYGKGSCTFIIHFVIISPIGQIYNISISLDWLLTTTPAIHWKVLADGQNGTTILWTMMKTIMTMLLYSRGTSHSICYCAEL